MKKKKDLEGICLWRTVADGDLKKIAEGNNIITLSQEKPCYDCTGYNTKCKNYYTIEDIEDDVRKYGQ